MSASRLRVSGSREAHNARLKGVEKTATELLRAVMLTDRAVLPWASQTRKLETLPPGQAATSIMPRATVGDGFRIRVNPKVAAGSKKNCAAKPTFLSSSKI